VSYTVNANPVSPGRQSMTSNKRLNFARPLTSVDLVVLALVDVELKVLLVRRTRGPDEPYPDAWALPGGFVDIERDTDLDACARRKLSEKAALTAPYLEQVGSWGSSNRDPRGWSTTHLYLALVGEEARALRAGGNSSDARWVTVNGLGVGERLAFDHAELLQRAIDRLHSKTEYTSLPAFWLPAEFTLSELQHAYEVGLRRPLEKKSFRTRVLASKLLAALPRQREGTNRPAQLYRLRDRDRPHYFARALAPSGRLDRPKKG
jgi:8-oxo-dGTP diphosphatase